MKEFRLLGILLLTIVIHVAEAGPKAQCNPSEIYKFRRQSQNLKSNCPVLRTYNGMTVTACQRLACDDGVNLVSHRDMTCVLHKCASQDTELVTNDIGWNIFIRGSTHPCGSDGRSTLICRTCDMITNDTECIEKGRMQACKHANSVCFFKTQQFKDRPLRFVSRGCRNYHGCKPEEFTTEGLCTSNKVLHQCIYCTYGSDKDSQCLQVNASNTEDTTCVSQFYLLDLRKRKTISSCPQLAYSGDFTKESCIDLACTIGGNAVNFAISSGECDIRLCQNDDLSLHETNDGNDYHFYTAVKDFKCDASKGKILACFVCNATTDEECFSTGEMSDCPDDSICGYEKITFGNEILSVKRGCRARSGCSDAELSLLLGKCAPYTYGQRKPAELCTQCGFMAPGAAYSCHNPFNVECVQRFLTYTHVAGIHSVCTVLHSGTHIGRDYCLDWACELAANVVYYSKLKINCTIMQCEGDKLVLPSWPGFITYVEDKDTCALGKHLCGENSVCVYTMPGYTCNCLPGFEGDGFTGCRDVDECLSDLTHVCGENAVCVNTDGSFICKCPEGFLGSPYVQCLDVDECSLAHGCDEHADCINTPGTYICMCHTGYHGNGVTCESEPCFCYVHGDPVVLTFDETRHPLLGVHRYHLSGNTQSNHATCRFDVFVGTKMMDRPGGFLIDNVEMQIKENQASEEMVNVVVDKDGVTYMTDTEVGYETVAVPGPIIGTYMITRVENGTWLINSRQNGCLLDLSINFSVDNADDAQLQLITSRSYILDGLCGNCNSDKDEYIGEHGEDLKLQGNWLMYLQNHIGDQVNNNEPI